MTDSKSEKVVPFIDKLDSWLVGSNFLTVMTCDYTYVPH